MKRLITVFAVSAYASIVNAYHPFVGANADAHTVQNEDGSVAIRL